MPTRLANESVPATVLRVKLDRMAAVLSFAALVGPFARPVSAVAAQHGASEAASDTAGSPTSVHADTPAGPPKEALDHYLRGRRLYLAGRYRDALVELKAALEVDRQAPDLLYNVARVYENLGELDEAIAYYQRYQARLAPDATDERDRTEKTIRRLQGARREVALTPPPAPPPAPAPVPHAGRADLAFWLTAGGALALFGGGAATGLLALKKRDDVAKFVVGADGPLERRNDLSDQADRFALITDGLFIAGGVAVTTAALLFLLRDAELESEPTDEKRTSLRFGLRVDPRTAQLHLTGAF